jgi:Zn-dependent protease
MLRSWRLGSACGIGIYVHSTFLLLPVLVLLQTPVAGGMSLALYRLALLGAICGCIVLHELGHALMARSYGIATQDITLYPIGGVARLERMSERPWEEFWIAVAGPAANVTLAGALLATTALFGLASSTEPSTALLRGSLGADLIRINFVLAVFNLLPAFPMDGGRVLRSLLSVPLGRLRATELAAGVGAILAFLLALAGLVSGHLLLLLVAAFIYGVGQQELASVRRSESIRRAPALEEVSVGPDCAGSPPPTDARFWLTWEASIDSWVLWQDGKPVRRYQVPPTDTGEPSDRVGRP